MSIIRKYGLKVYLKIKLKIIIQIINYTKWTNGSERTKSLWIDLFTKGTKL